MDASCQGDEMSGSVYDECEMFILDQSRVIIPRVFERIDPPFSKAQFVDLLLGEEGDLFVNGQLKTQLQGGTGSLTGQPCRRCGDRSDAAGQLLEMSAGTGCNWTPN